MGKNKGSKPKVNNVFKVAGARSLKVKNKAKQVAGQLKKLNEVNKQKIREVDSQLDSLHSTLMQQKPSVAASNSGAVNNKEKCAERAQQAVVLNKNVKDIEKIGNVKL